MDRVAMISLHTSPLDQPGTGDAGGMNVYVLELSRRLAERDLEVEIYTRATSSALPPVVEVRHAGRARPPRRGRTLRGARQGGAARPAVHLRPRAAARRGGPRAGLVRPHPLALLALRPGRRAARDRWSVPLAHTMHTMAKVKNDALAEGDTPEPAARLLGEEQVVEAADMLIANTDLEAKQLINLYDADPDPRRGRPPRRRPRRLPPRGPGGGPPARSASPPTRSSRCSSAASSRSRPPTSCSGRSRCCSSATRRCARASSSPSSADRPAPGSSTPSPSPTSPPRSASTTSSASCRRSTRPTSSTGTPRPRWCACRRTTSPSGWSRSRPRPSVRRSWPPPSAA